MAIGFLFIVPLLKCRTGIVFLSQILNRQYRRWSYESSVLELKVAKEDMGKVIGKKGRTAQAMRDILSAASGKVKKRTVLEILE